MTVLEFKRPAPAPAQAYEPAQQHGSGTAFCIGCRHEWAAVAPTGCTAFEFPSCGAHKGKWKFEFYPPEGQMIRVCGCGNEFFYLTPDGHLCANCGVYQGY